MVVSRSQVLNCRILNCRATCEVTTLWQRVSGSSPLTILKGHGRKIMSEEVIHKITSLEACIMFVKQAGHMNTVIRKRFKSRRMYDYSYRNLVKVGSTVCSGMNKREISRRLCASEFWSQTDLNLVGSYEEFCSLFLKLLLHNCATLMGLLANWAINQPKSRTLLCGNVWFRTTIYKVNNDITIKPSMTIHCCN